MRGIGELLGKDSDDYTLSEDMRKDVCENANIEGTNLKEKLEISYAYNRIGEADRERIAALIDSDFRDFFYSHDAFGVWRWFLNALKAQIKSASMRNIRDVRQLLEQAKQQLGAGESSRLLDEANRLIEQEQNYAVAEDYIHRFMNGERNFPFENIDGLATAKHFDKFMGTFTKLYGLCERRKEDTLPKFSDNFVDNNVPEGWTSRNISDAKRFLHLWPTGKSGVYAQGIKDFISMIGFDIKSAKNSDRSNIKCFVLDVTASAHNQPGYTHPIPDFGTQLKKQIDVVCLFGKYTPTQLVDTVCKLGITSTFIVMLDSQLSSIERQKMAEYFFTQKNGGQASFLVIDRVLALYLALQSNNERMPALLQCTLPYTICAPFTNGSGYTADEMFCGRVSELAAIRDMRGSSIVYGGRQLGKTALL